MQNRQEIQASPAYVVPQGEERLTASELANLWVSYIDNDLKIRVLERFSAVIEDPEHKRSGKECFKLCQGTYTKD